MNFKEELLELLDETLANKTLDLIIKYLEEKRNTVYAIHLYSEKNDRVINQHKYPNWIEIQNYIDLEIIEELKT